MRPLRRRRRGFTFVELLVSMTVVGLLSAVAVPKYIDLKRRANTTKVLGDFQAVRVAVMSFYADSSYWPEGGAELGTIPPNLERYLPIGFSFSRTTWKLKYEIWELGQAPFTSASALVGVTVVTDDPVLGETTSRLLGNVPQIASGNSFTFMVSGM